jgi:glutathione S-transferase
MSDGLAEPAGDVRRESGGEIRRERDGGIRSESGSRGPRSARIHGYLISTWTRTACMVCVEKAIDYKLMPVAYGSPAHTDLHPFGRMPILEVDGRTIIESLAITGYLDDAFPGPSLAPRDPVARARMHTWMGICGDYMFRDVVRLIPRDRAPSEHELSTARTALERAERLLPGSPFLVGDSLTLADLYLAPQISNCREKAPELLDDLACLTAWADRISRRESFELTRY